MNMERSFEVPNNVNNESFESIPETTDTNGTEKKVEMEGLSGAMAQEEGVDAVLAIAIEEVDLGEGKPTAEATGSESRWKGLGRNKSGGQGPPRPLASVLSPAPSYTRLAPTPPVVAAAAASSAQLQAAPPVSSSTAPSGGGAGGVVVVAGGPQPLPGLIPGHLQLYTPLSVPPVGGNNSNSVAAGGGVPPSLGGGPPVGGVGGGVVGGPPSASSSLPSIARPPPGGAPPPAGVPPGFRYPPFNPTPEYYPPPNPRIGAAGLPPSATAPEDLPPPSDSPLPVAPRTLSGPGSLSCPTSLSEAALPLPQQGLPSNPAQGFASPHPARGALGARAVGFQAPGGCWSLPRSVVFPSVASSSEAASRLSDIGEKMNSSSGGGGGGGGGGGNGGGGGEMGNGGGGGMGGMGPVAHPRGISAPASLGGPVEEFKTRSLPTRCLHGARPPLLSRRALVLSEGEGGMGGSSSLLCEEDGFYFRQTVTEEEREEDDELYGSSQDLSSGSSILEKLMVWAYYNSDAQEAGKD
ncbi:uncharacterized protein LOC143020958 [Oratosquilla oratoria]|uniref:uncharacterized protein LOC143020958 n=1 Tax=Oratosquilla oratoria TaxID=337810 RepID=UPI003F768284